MNEKKTFRPIPGLSREEEEKRLAEIIGIAQENLERTEEIIGGLSEELHDLMETYGAKDKEALSMLHNTQSQLHERKRDLLRCQKARKKPYFGRIDFKDPNIPWEESYYVGRVGISENGSDPVVIDWRAPVASVYYENATGPCEYTVKNVGTCKIDLKRKRTYEIADDRLKDFFDSDVVANDELLNKYLAKNKKAVLGEIIATIQKEQNTIIRKSPKTNLIVQGVAGSGKTTVAMHRISYILYNYADRFRPEDFYIIGSNRILLNYITSVLPDLDVYGVRQMTMEQLFVRLLYEDWDPAVHQIRPSGAMDASGSARKGSLSWFHDLENFCREYEAEAVPAKDVKIEKNGVVLMEEAAIKSYLENNGRLSMQEKINMLNGILSSKLENELTGKHVSYTDAEKKELARQFRWHFGKDPWKGSVFEVYEEFLLRQTQGGKTVSYEKNRFDLYDLAALAYLYRRIKETDRIREASHVIIDEAQDFGMMAYGVLAYCLYGCTYTIMGDVSQNIHYGYGLNDWEELKSLILTGAFDSFGLLKKSYRNTVEISKFATDILRHGTFPVYPVEPIIRHGNEVRVEECADEEAMVSEAVRTIKGWQAEGRETIAVICRDEEEAVHVRERLGEHLALADSRPETAEFGCGIFVLPVEYTKGLEFDAVLIYHPSEESYPADDRYVKLLYVAATRALHELAVLHLGDLTGLIGTPVPEEKRMESLEGGGLAGRAPDAGRRTRAAFGGISGVGADTPAMDVAGLNVSGQTGAKRPESGAANRKVLIRRRPATAGAATEITGSRPKEEQLRPATPAPSTPLRRPAAPKPVNPSNHPFLSVPNNSILRPAGHSRIDTSVRIVRKTRRYLDIISSYGVLRLTPVADTMVRVQFVKGQMTDFVPGFWNYRPETPVSWSAREGRTLVELSTAKVVIRIDKKSGALLFYDKSGKLLLSEKPALPRQIESGELARTWVYFDWKKNEKLSARGLLEDDLERMNLKARYISFGGKSLRMPLLISDFGYGIGVAADKTVMCCAIPMYGPYLYTEGTAQIDYYFLYGTTYEEIKKLYKML